MRPLFRDLLNVVKYDQGMTSKIISVANSTYYNRGAQILSLDAAMMAIGFDEIRRIVICLVFFKEMQNQWAIGQDDILSLWSHTLSVACAAKVLAEKTEAEDSDKAFTFSILHDIGRAPFLMYGGGYREMQAEARCTGRDVCSIEREAFGIDHAEPGHVISVRLNFPEQLSKVILGHHGTGDSGATDRSSGKADRFVEFPQVDIGPEGIILREGADAIKAETTRIAQLLGVM